MALNIKDTQTDRLARELAALTGDSITVSLRRALQERLARLRAEQAVSATGPDLTAIIERGRSRRVLDDRTEAEILGHDDAGMPR